MYPRSREQIPLETSVLKEGNNSTEGRKPARAQKKNRMKRSITIAGVRFRGDSLLLIFFLLLVLCVQTVPGWGNAYAMYVYPSIAPDASVLLPAYPFRHRRPVHCAKYRRRTSLPCLRALHPQTEMEQPLSC